MNEIQIMNIYRMNGLNDYKLRSTQDLVKIHGIEFKAVEGYKSLDDVNRLLYEKFIVNLFNAQGLVTRSTLIPKGIYYVEYTEYLTKDRPDDESFTISGGSVYSINRDGFKSILHSWAAEGYENLEILQKEATNYLRFEYEVSGKATWLHVMNETTWY